MISAILPALLKGAAITVVIALASGVLGIAISFAAGLARTSRFRSVRVATALYVEVFRGTSALVQLFVFFYVLPLVGVRLPPFAAGVIALGLNFGAYGSEIVRGGIKSVDRGQREAAVALNMTPALAMRRVVLPQAILPMVPPFTNLLVELVKGSSLVSLIAITDLAFAGRQQIAAVGQAPLIYTLVLVLYYVLAQPFARGGAWLERRVRVRLGVGPPQMTFDFGYAIQILPSLLAGAVITVVAALLGFALAAVVGLLLAVASTSRRRVVRLPTALIVDFVRSTPLLIQLFFVFYVLPLYGLILEPLATGIVVLGLHYSAYTSEVYRAGIHAVPRGQWEAAVALNFSGLQTWQRIILPQAIQPVIPALGNYLVSIFKETPVLAFITVGEILRAAMANAGTTFRFLEPITLVGLFFLAVSYPSALIVRRLEARYGTP